MPSISLGAYRTLFVAYIVYASCRTIHEMGHGHAGLGALAPVVIGLAIVEILAALALLFRPARAAGAIALLAVFAAVAVIDFWTGGWPLHLVLYAGTVLFLVTLDREKTDAETSSAM